MSLFVIPIAVVGLDILPAGSNPDLFVLTLPLSAEQNGLAMLAFLGGFSSATSMVIVAAIALSTMISNHIVTPIWLRARGQGATISGDVRSVVLTSRRISIIGILTLGYLYYRISGGGAALASIGLISFCRCRADLTCDAGGNLLASCDQNWGPGWVNLRVGGLELHDVSAVLWAGSADFPRDNRPWALGAAMAAADRLVWHRGAGSGGACGLVVDFAEQFRLRGRLHLVETVSLRAGASGAIYQRF
jgi:hypothetical protein